MKKTLQILVNNEVQEEKTDRSMLSASATPLPAPKLNRKEIKRMEMEKALAQMNIFSLKFFCIKYGILGLSFISLLYAVFHKSDQESKILTTQICIQSAQFMFFSITLIFSYLVNSYLSKRLLVISLIFLAISLTLSIIATLLYLFLSIKTITTWVPNIFIFLHSILEFSLILITKKRVSIKKIKPITQSRSQTMKQWEQNRRKVADLRVGANESKDANNLSISSKHSEGEGKGTKRNKKEFQFVCYRKKRACDVCAQPFEKYQRHVYLLKCEHEMHIYCSMKERQVSTYLCPNCQLVIGSEEFQKAQSVRRHSTFIDLTSHNKRLNSASSLLDIIPGESGISSKKKLRAKAKEVVKTDKQLNFWQYEVTEAKREHKPIQDEEVKEEEIEIRN